MKSDEGNSTADASSDKDKKSEGDASTSKDEEEEKSKEPNDGVKILQEVFGSEDKSGPKDEKKDALVIGPAIPKEADYDPEELKKAEEFKAQGNDFFKRKFIFRVFFIYF